MVLYTNTVVKIPNRQLVWTIVDEADRLFNDSEFCDFSDIELPLIFTTVSALNVWLAELADTLQDECEFTYNEYLIARLSEMEPGERYPLYTYTNTNGIWTNLRRGFVVAN